MTKATAKRSPKQTSEKTLQLSPAAAPGSRHAMATLQARSARSLMRIMDAAEDILRLEGIDGLTLPAVAARSGVSVGGIYRRFQGKQDILRAVKDRLLFQLRENVRLSMACEFASIQDVLHRYVQTAIDEMSSRGGLYTLILANQGEDATMIKLGYDVLDHNYDALRGQLLRFSADMQHEDPDLAVRMVFIMILAAMMRRSSRFTSPAEAMSWEVFGRELTRMAITYLIGA